MLGSHRSSLIWIQMSSHSCGQSLEGMYCTLLLRNTSNKQFTDHHHHVSSCLDIRQKCFIQILHHEWAITFPGGPNMKPRLLPGATHFFPLSTKYRKTYSGLTLILIIISKQHLIKNNYYIKYISIFISDSGSTAHTHKHKHDIRHTTRTVIENKDKKE